MEVYTREGGREGGGREGRREGVSEGGREGGREGRREGGRETWNSREAKVMEENIQGDEKLASRVHFCSLEESVQDPMVFSLLDVISMLCADRMVPSDAWDFILCSIITITHVCIHTHTLHTAGAHLEALH